MFYNASRLIFDVVFLDPLSLCVDAKMNKHEVGIRNSDVLINYIPDRSDVKREFISFIGEIYYSCYSSI